MIRTAALLVRLAFEVADEMRLELRRRRKQKQWAETPIRLRACKRCHEVAYSPTATFCDKCGEDL